jgi:putative acetyltransferase
VIRIVEDDLSGAAIRALLEQHFSHMLANSPKDSCHFLDFDGLKGPDVTFWSAWIGDDLGGCGALREIAPDHGEVKSMRTASAMQRRGVAAAILNHMIAVARSRGYRRLSLETGSGPAFDPAHALYAMFGFFPCEPFGDYTHDPFSRYFTLAL